MENCTVQVVEHPAGIVQGCKKCKTVLLQGNFTIGLTIKEGNRAKKYLLGASPQEHCGEVKTFFQVFGTEAGAEAKKEEVIAHLDTTGTTEGLRLMKWIIPSLN